MSILTAAEQNNPVDNSVSRFQQSALCFILVADLAPDAEVTK